MLDCLLDCLIAVSAEVDPLPDRKGFGYSRLTTSSQTQGEMPVVKGEAPSLGWLPVPHSRHSTVELAIGTCRHHLPMVASEGHPCQPLKCLHSFT